MNARITRVVHLPNGNVRSDNDNGKYAEMYRAQWDAIQEGRERFNDLFRTETGGE